MVPRAFLAAATALAACTPVADKAPARESYLAVPSPKPVGPLDELDLRLRLASPTVRSGGELAANLVVANTTGSTVADPECRLAAPRSAIVSPDDADPELWQQVVVDCSGIVLSPGDVERFSLTFMATTKYGDPLPPGDYVVVVDYEGVTRRFRVPVTVTE